MSNLEDAGYLYKCIRYGDLDKCKNCDGYGRIEDTSCYLPLSKIINQIKDVYNKFIDKTEHTNFFKKHIKEELDNQTQKELSDFLKQNELEK